MLPFFSQPRLHFEKVALTGLMVIILSCITGCAAKTDRMYQEPATRVLDVMAPTYSYPISKVWKAALFALQNHPGCMIDSALVDSGSIVATFTFNDPTEIVDCGTIAVHNDTLRSQYETQFFSGAQKEVKYYMATGYVVPQEIIRKVRLTGKGNLIMKEIAPGKTQIALKIQYNLALETSGMQYTHTNHGILNTPAFAPFTVRSEIVFYSGQEGKGNDGIGPEVNELNLAGGREMLCRPLGTLEQDILNRISANL